MTIIVTDEAFERYARLTNTLDVSNLNGRAMLEAKLQEELAGGAGGLLQWMGKPALYANGIYWQYVREEENDCLLLVGCLGMLQPVGLSRFRTEERDHRAS